MRVHVTISFDEDHDASREPWPAITAALRDRILDDPAGYLDSADVPRSHLTVTVVPR